MILIIAITNKESFVGLSDGIKYVFVNQISKDSQKDKLLLKINEIISPKNIGGVIVYTGPGPFTGVRVAVSIANALSYALGVPVAGVSKIDDKEKMLRIGLKNLKEDNQKIVFPVYDKEPNITKPKKC